MVSVEIAIIMTMMCLFISIQAHLRGINATENIGTSPHRHGHGNVTLPQHKTNATSGYWRWGDDHNHWNDDYNHWNDDHNHWGDDRH